jgi:hypothetical protein
MGSFCYYVSSFAFVKNSTILYKKNLTIEQCSIIMQVLNCINWTNFAYNKLTLSMEDGVNVNIKKSNDFGYFVFADSNFNSEKLFEIDSFFCELSKFVTENYSKSTDWNLHNIYFDELYKKYF